MKNKDLIEKLKAFPEDMEVCIYDWKKNMNDDIGDGSSVGVYPDIEISEVKLEGDEAAFFKEQNDKNFIPWVAISFENEEYDEEGNKIE